jgi:hypothetical protein
MRLLDATLSHVTCKPLMACNEYSSCEAKCHCLAYFVALIVASWELQLLYQHIASAADDVILFLLLDPYPSKWKKVQKNPARVMNRMERIHICCGHKILSDLRCQGMQSINHQMKRHTQTLRTFTVASKRYLTKATLLCTDLACVVALGSTVATVVLSHPNVELVSLAIWVRLLVPGNTHFRPLDS